MTAQLTLLPVDAAAALPQLPAAAAAAAAANKKSKDRAGAFIRIDGQMGRTAC